MRILAVDDDVVFLKLLTAVLAEAGYDAVTTAVSGKQALQIIAAADVKFDCLLLDIVMPGMSGIDLCRKIRAMSDYTDTPILMLTGLSDETSIEQAFTAGANDYVTKPLRGLELGSRIRLAAQLAELRERNLQLLQAETLAGYVTEGAWTAKRPAIVPLTEIAGVVNYLQLENYLYRIGEGEFPLRMFALAFPDFENWVRRRGNTDPHALMRDLAKSVSRTISNSQSLIASPSDGVLLFVQKGWHRVSVPAVCSSVRQSFCEWFGEQLAESIDFQVRVDRRADAVVHSGTEAAERLRKFVKDIAGELEDLEKRQRLQGLRDIASDRHGLLDFFGDFKIRPRRIPRVSA